MAAFRSTPAARSRSSAAGSCAAEKRSSLDSSAPAVQRVRHADHVLIGVRVPEPGGPIVAALVVAQVDDHAAHHLRYAEIPMRVLDVGAVEREPAQRGAEL